MSEKDKTAICCVISVPTARNKSKDVNPVAVKKSLRRLDFLNSKKQIPGQVFTSETMILALLPVYFEK